MFRARSVVLALACAFACGGDPPRRPPPEPETKKEPAGPAARGGETHTLGESDAGQAQSILVGDRVLVELPGAPTGGGPEGARAWDDPAITGDAVRFVNREQKSPPPDGAHATDVFELRAVRTGRSTLTIPPKAKDAKSAPKPYALEFIVNNPD